MTRSSGSPGFLPIVSGFIILISGWTPALETVTMGQDGQLDWQGQGTTAPLGEIIGGLHRSPLSPNNIVEGNTPGNLIELNNPDYPKGMLLPWVDEGENITHGTLERGGWIDAPNVFAAGEGFSFAGGFDRNDLLALLEELISAEEGDETSAFARENPNAFGILINLNLGERFGVNRIRFYPRNTLRPSPTTPFQDNYIRAFELSINDGIAQTKGGNPAYQPLVVETDNRNSVIVVDIDPPRMIQYIQLKSITPIDWEIDELEVFGRGFLTTGTYISDIFDAGRPAAWTDLRWSEEIIGDPKFSNLDIRTRTGTDVSPFVFTRILRGKLDPPEIPCAINSLAEELPCESSGLTQEMDLDGYRSLPQADDLNRDWEPGPVKDDLVNWSPFSSPYPASAANGPGVPIISPSPRRYFQFQVRFTSNDLDAARVLKSLSFDFATPPLADSLQAEIFPRQVEVSQTIPFTFVVRAVMQTSGLTGFDTIQIPTPARVESIDSIELLDANGQGLAGREFTGLDDTTLVDEFQIVSVEDDGFVLRFPRVRQNHTQVQIRFQTEVLTYSTNFAASVWLADEPNAFQEVTPGNAADLAAGDDPDFSGPTVLSPSVLAGGRLIDKVKLIPSTITPNGDGVNDVLTVHYNLLALSAPRPVAIRVYDLSGRLVRVIHDAPESSGHYEDKTWDGRNDQGRLLAPGLYILQIEVNGDAADAEQSQVLGLVY